MKLDHDDHLAIAEQIHAFQHDCLLRESDVARVLAIGKSSVRHYVSKGLLPPPLKFGCNAVWRNSDIQAVIQGLGVAA